MGQLEDEIWEASVFLVEWDGSDDYGDIRWKLLEVPRDAIDGDDDNPPAHMLLGIDNGGVRRYDILMDAAYDRWDPSEHQETLDLAIKSAPIEAKILNQYQ